MNKFEQLLKALYGSVASIPVKASDEERQDALGKAFEGFEVELADLITGVRLDAFDCGVRGDLRKFHGQDGSEEQGLDHIADFSQVVRSVTGAVELMKADNMSPAVQQAVGLWADMGRTVLGAMVSEVDVNDAGLQKSERSESAEQLKKNLDEVQALTLMLRKRAKALAKDDAAAGAVDGGDVSQMDPLEVIGRLAAAILVQIDALMGDDDQQDDQGEPEPGETGGDQGAAAPAAKAEGTDGLAKGAPDADALAKLQAENGELKKKLAAAAAKPADPAAAPALRAVDKTGDVPLGKSNEETLEETADRLAKMSPEQRSLEMTKIALRRGVKVA